MHDVVLPSDISPNLVYACAKSPSAAWESSVGEVARDCELQGTSLVGVYADRETRYIGERQPRWRPAFDRQLYGEPQSRLRSPLGLIGSV